MVLVRDNVLTMQFHPDLTPRLMMDKIWPALLAKGYVRIEQRTECEASMETLNTSDCLKFIRQFAAII